MPSKIFLGIFFFLTLNVMAGEAPGVKMVTHYGGIKVIVQAKNKILSLTKKEVSDIFLRKKTQWPDRTTITPFDLKYDSKVREVFSKQFHGRSPMFIKKYWQQKIFGGYELPPLEKEPSDALHSVAKTDGGICYIPANVELPPSVKEIAIRD